MKVRINEVKPVDEGDFKVGDIFNVKEYEHDEAFYIILDEGDLEGIMLPKTQATIIK